MRLLRPLLSFATLLVVLLSLPATASAAPGLPARWDKGFNWTQWWNDAYSSSQAQQTLDGLANTGANSVSFIPTYYMSCGSCIDMAADRDRSPSDNDLRVGVQRAKAKGLKTFFRPMLDSHDGVFRGNYAPGDVNGWFNNYRQFIYRYADIAQQTGVDQLSIGVELSNLSRPQYDGQWRTLIAGVRARYKGKLTFGANWDSYQHVTFWDALDSIGIDAYFPLATGNTPSEADVTRAWSSYTDSYGNRRNYIAELEAFSKRWNKQISFNELGFPANTRSLVEPWAWSGGTYDGDAHARSLTGTLAAFADKPWFDGVYIWNWMSVTGRGGYGDTSAVVQGKPAEGALTQWFRAPAINVPAPAPSPSPAPSPAPAPQQPVTPAPVGTDKARDRPVTASSVEFPQHESRFAVDGDPSTRWSSGYAEGQSLTVDLGSVRQVDRVRINWEAAYAARYRISTSVDGQTFIDAAEVTTDRAGEKTTSFAARGARHVRFTSVARGGYGNVSFWDLEVFGPEDAQGVEKAQGKTATASSVEGPGLEAAKAVDGNPATRFSSTYADNQSFSVDLGAVRRVDRVRINWEAAYASRYRIATSRDGQTYSDAADVTIAKAGVESTSFTARDARYVRLTAVTRGTQWGVSFYDFEVYGPADVVSVEKAAGRTVAVSSTERAGVEGDKAVDEDPTTRFSSQYADYQWLQVDLGSVRKINKLEINWEAAYASRYEIITSTNGNDFTQAAEVTIGKPGVESTEFATRDARYVLVKGLNRATPYGISFYDLKVFGPQD